MLNLIALFRTHTYLLLCYALFEVGWHAARASEPSKRNRREKKKNQWKDQFQHDLHGENSPEDAFFSSKIFSLTPRIYRNH